MRGGEEVGVAGVIGLGNLGRPIVRRLSEMGRPVAVFDSDRSRMWALRGPGVTLAPSLAAVGRRCETVIVLTRTVEQAETVVAGLSGGPDVATRVVLHVTASPPAVRALADLARTQGLELIEAPLSGGAQAAREGQLSAIVGSTAEVPGPVLELLGLYTSKRWLSGPIGSASAVKLANQVLLAGSWLLGRDVLKMTRGFDVGPELVRDFVAASTGACWAVEHMDLLDAGFAGLAVKDLRSALTAFEVAGVVSPLAQRMLDLLVEGPHAGPG